MQVMLFSLSNTVVTVTVIRDVAMLQMFIYVYVVAMQLYTTIASLYISIALGT